ncbi:MAG: AtzE family amidohydrolase [Betaproteobacteria bacterium]
MSAHSAQASEAALSACERLGQALARIDATDGRIHAFTQVLRERAWREAEAVDARRARGEVLGPLAGMPYAVKNLFDIASEVTLAGSKVNRSLPPAATDAVLVQQLHKAGAVLVGALNMDEYAYGFTTENTHYGATHNPHRLGHLAGGSSGGSAAAVAAAQVPLALGSDTNGSIRVPASLCGVWGLKPTFGRLSRRGSYPFVHSIDHLGPIAQDVGTLAAAYDALQLPDPLDPGCHAQRIQPVTATLGHGTEGLRIGILGGYFHDNAGPAARAASQAVAQALGASAEVIWPDAELGRACAFVITAAEGGSLHLHSLRERADDFEPLSVDRFIAGALQPAAWYVRAQRFRRVYRDRVNELFKHWDLLIAPATPVAAPAIGTDWIEVNGQRHPCRPSLGMLTQPVSAAGCPVVSAPIWPAQAQGLPIGVQLITAPWREDLALRAAMQLQRSAVAHTKEAAL